MREEGQTNRRKKTETRITTYTERQRNRKIFNKTQLAFFNNKLRLRTVELKIDEKLIEIFFIHKMKNVSHLTDCVSELRTKRCIE